MKFSHNENEKGWGNLRIKVLPQTAEIGDKHKSLRIINVLSIYTISNRSKNQANPYSTQRTFHHMHFEGIYLARLALISEYACLFYVLWIESLFCWLRWDGHRTQWNWCINVKSLFYINRMGFLCSLIFHFCLLLSITPWLRAVLIPYPICILFNFNYSELECRFCSISFSVCHFFVAVEF